MCRQCFRSIAQQFFVKFFSWTKPCIYYFNVYIWLKTRQSYHSLCQVHYFHRLSHIEDKNLSSYAHSSSLKNQLARLWNGHKVSHNIWMGNRNRPAFFYLFFEIWDNRTIRPQNISETSGHKLSHISWLILKRLNEQFSCSFRGSHHIGRIYRLVRRDHHKGIHFVFTCEKSQIFTPLNIHQNSLMWIFFHQRNMFIGSGMIDHRKFIFFKYTFEPIDIRNIR